jgi:hypothetical protein
LTVVNMALAEFDPHTAAIHSVMSGCEPVGVTASPDGHYVWVTALGDHAVLAFSAHRLLHAPASSLRASVLLGQAPARMLSVGGWLLVTDSTPAGGLSVLDTRAALEHRPALLGEIRPGFGTTAASYVSAARALLVAYAAAPDVELLRAAGIP